MKLRFFHIPVHGDPAATEELNSFLARHRIRDLDRRFVDAGTNSFWAISVTYLDGASAAGAVPGAKERIDYREVLSPAEFAVFAKVRALRKDLAARDAVPVYHVLTNDQIAELVRRRAMTRAALEKVDGLGTARLAKYGDALLAVLVELIPTLPRPGDDEAKPDPDRSGR